MGTLEQTYLNQLATKMSEVAKKEEENFVVLTLPLSLPAYPILEAACLFLEADLRLLPTF